MKLAAIIVLYFPDYFQLEKNIDRCIKNVDKLILWQNTPSNFAPDNAQHGLLIEKYKNKLIILGEKRNVGIATGLNISVQWAINNAYTHVLTLDQDSSFGDGMLIKYKSLITELNLPNVGVYGINPNNWGHLLYSCDELFIEVSDTITSGSIIPIEIFNKYGFFEDDLFIDAVDYEYCYRLKKHGLKIIVFNSIILNHQVGHAKKTWLGFKTDNYSAFRTYYLIRNQVAIWKRYPNYFPKQYKIVLVKGHIIFRIVKILLGESDKWNKIKAIFVGLKHAFEGRTGYYKF